MTMSPPQVVPCDAAHQCDASCKAFPVAVYKRAHKHVWLPATFAPHMPEHSQTAGFDPECLRWATAKIWENYQESQYNLVKWRLKLNIGSLHAFWNDGLRSFLTAYASDGYSDQWFSDYLWQLLYLMCFVISASEHVFWKRCVLISFSTSKDKHICLRKQIQLIHLLRHQGCLK